MSEKYILIKESVLNSRIEELKQKQAEEFCMQDEAVIYFNIREELQSLKQKGEVVEVENNETLTDLFHSTRPAGLPFGEFVENKGYKLLKTNNERS